jgi:hypothetical protein
VRGFPVWTDGGIAADAPKGKFIRPSQS